MTRPAVVSSSLGSTGMSSTQLLNLGVPSPAYDWLTINGLPDPKAKAWEYAPLGDLKELFFSATPVSNKTSPPPVLDLPFLASDELAYRLVFVNGQFVSSLSSHPATVPLPPGVIAAPFSQLAVSQSDTPASVLGRWASPRLDSYTKNEGFTVLNQASVYDPAVVKIPSSVAVGSLIHVLHVRTDTPSIPTVLAQPQLLVEVASGARVSVLESFLSTTGGFTNAVTRICLEADSQLHHVRVQDEHPASGHVSTILVTQHQGSHLESVSLNLGARVSRSFLNVSFLGDQASTQLYGLTSLSSSQRADTMVSVNHHHSNCISSQDFRSVVSSHARASFTGHVLVGPSGSATDSSQQSRNLLLSPTAQVDTRPWLEILTDDVKCTHGATVGALDEAALFYLRSRGIPAVLAERMLVLAFASSIVDRVESPSLRRLLHARLDYPSNENHQVREDQSASESQAVKTSQPAGLSHQAKENILFGGKSHGW